MTEMDFTIRVCQAPDVPAIAELCRQWVAEDVTQCFVADTEEGLLKRMNPYFLAAEFGGQVVGYVIAKVLPTAGDAYGNGFPGETHYLVVEDLCVGAAFRGQGIGTALMRTVLQKATDAGIARSLVYSGNKDYARIARFYEKCGFRMWHILMRR